MRAHRKTLKSVVSKSPTKIVQTQSDHNFISIYSDYHLEWLSVKRRQNCVYRVGDR